MNLVEGDALRQVALYNAPEAFAAARTNKVFRPHPQGMITTAIRTRQVVHLADMRTTPPYLERSAGTAELIELAGARTVAVVPMLRDNEVIGAITIYRQEVRPFGEKQIELLTNFARQAVIAIENARLLRELRQRTNDLSEALERQTATSEVLKVISSSPGELKPVFEAMLAYAVRICEAKFGTLFLCEGDDFRVVAEHNTPPALVELHQREPIRHVGPSTSLYRSKKAKQPIQIADLTAEPAYFERDQNRVALVELGGYRGVLSVPMVEEDEVIGAINMYRQDAGTFLDNQVELVKNFAAQAVIAIENARLLNELRQGTDDLSEALEQQTATSEVLRVISSSPGELEPVFQSMLENATRLCEANFGILFVGEGNVFRSVAVHSPPSAYTEWYEHHPFFNVKDHPQSLLARLAESREIIHIADLRLDPSYAARVPILVAFVDIAGARTVLVVPMVKEDKLIGAIVIYRTEVRPFSEKQI
jgi:GAF domain-containing protein